MAKRAAKKATSAKRSTSKRPNDPAAALRAALLHLIATQGWRDLSLAEIAEEAGMDMAEAHGIYATKAAILLGLAGHVPANIDPDAADAEVARIRATGRLRLGGGREIAFDEASDLHFLQRERLAFHSNAMTCVAYDAAGNLIGTAPVSAGPGVDPDSPAGPAIVAPAIAALKTELGKPATLAVEARTSIP